MKKLLMFILVMMAAGELEEIKYQEINFGDYIKQVALVEIITDNYNFINYCNDCTAQITVKDMADNTIVENEIMIDLGDSLFGYIASSDQLDADTQYLMVFNATSGEYGSGLAYSYFYVNKTATSGAIDTDGLSSWLQQIYQEIADLIGYTMRGENVCQVVADDNSDFSSPNINHRTYITDYTFDEYLPQGNYFWKVRCMKADRWGMWSEVGNFSHTNSSVYMDWTVR